MRRIDVLLWHIHVNILNSDIWDLLQVNNNNNVSVGRMCNDPYYQVNVNGL